MALMGTMDQRFSVGLEFPCLPGSFQAGFKWQRHYWPVAAAFPAVWRYHKQLLSGEFRAVDLQRPASQTGASFP